MPKTKISEFSATPGNNTDIDGINIAEGCAPSGINDAIRELMAQLKDFQAGTAGDSFNGPVGTSTAAAGAFTTLTTSSTVTHNGGTANGVAYLNGSKVLTTGSALTFDGTGFQLSTSTGGNFYLNSTTTGTSNQIVSLLNNGNSYGNLNYKAFDHIWSYGATEQARLTSTGLGIGTSSPAYRLDVSATGTTVSSAFRSDQSEMWMMLKDSGTTLGHVRLGSASGAMLFYSGNNTRATLDSVGNLGLGVTPSAWNSTYDAIQVGSAGLITSRAVGSGIDNIQIGVNWYRDTGGTFRYAGSGAGSDYTQTGGAHQWFTAPSGTAGNAISFTQAMTLDASGNLLLGGTSTAYGTANRVTMELTAATSVLYALRTSNTNRGYLFADSSTLGIEAETSCDLKLNAIGSKTIQLFTNNTERARITSGGDLLVGTTSASGKFVSSTSANTTYSGWFDSSASSGALRGVQVKYSGQSPNDAGNIMFLCADSTASRMYVNSNGGIGNYQANDVNLSDRREKTNLAPAKSYLDTICAIPVQTFNYIDQNLEEDPGLTLGVVAQDVQAVAPELVMESNWGTEENPKMRLSIYQTDLQYALMKALQELKAEFDAYKATHP